MLAARRLSCTDTATIHTSTNAIIAFLLEGTRRTLYPAPIDIHRTLGWRMAFAAVNFVLMIALLLIPYQLMSQAAYTDSLAFIHPVLAIIGV